MLLTLFGFLAFVVVLAAICLAAIAFGRWRVRMGSQADAAAIRELESRLTSLRADPRDVSLHKLLCRFLHAHADVLASRSESVYQAILGLVAANSSCSELKQLALEVGRWHAACHRGVVSIYDEQAIQNDLHVRAR